MFSPWPMIINHSEEAAQDNTYLALSSQMDKSGIQHQRLAHRSHPHHWALVLDLLDHHFSTYTRSRPTFSFVTMMERWQTPSVENKSSTVEPKSVITVGICTGRCIQADRSSLDITLIRLRPFLRILAGIASEQNGFELTVMYPFQMTSSSSKVLH